MATRPPKSLLRLELRKRRISASIIGTQERPRLSVFRGLNTCFLQLIDDGAGKTLVSVAERELAATDRKKTKVERAQLLGEMLAKKAVAKGVSKAVFDRGVARYHGRVKAVADGARAGGLDF